MELSREIIEENFKTFLDLLEPAVTAREGAKWERLKEKLENSDFMTAPASTKYHASYAGGLVDHSLNVYYNLCSLVKSKHLEDKIPSDSIAICALLHDFSKMNLYTTTVRNKKYYYDAGSKYDELGRFDWVSEMTYTIKPESERFIYGNHEETSEFMVRTYIPLKYEESMAILHHHMGMSYDSTQGNSAMNAASKFPLVALLHMADFIATAIDEKEDLYE